MRRFDSLLSVRVNLQKPQSLTVSVPDMEDIKRTKVHQRLSLLSYEKMIWIHRVHTKGVMQQYAS